MSRVLVTGASGFIGSAVVAALARDGYTVRAAVRRPHLSFPDGVEVVQHPDLAEAFDWQPLLQNVDQVVHLAGIAHTRGANAAAYDRVNRLATARLAAAAALEISARTTWSGAGHDAQHLSSLTRALLILPASLVLGIVGASLAIVSGGRGGASRAIGIAGGIILLAPLIAAICRGDFR